MTNSRLIIIKLVLLVIATAIFGLRLSPVQAEAAPGDRRDRQHLVFWAGSPQELEVYKIYGRREGPTVMIIGGIQGDEPGGFMSADLYADMALKRGNLIVVPRANFQSIIKYHRGLHGDMNRKFQGDLSRDTDQATVEILKDLMEESDLLLNLHDGSGYYRPTWESKLANPNRYGQCIIADADVYIHPETGRQIPLAEYAEEVVKRVNEEISEPLYKFHFFNTKTGEKGSPHAEQQGSATWFALTKIGIPAFGVETSKQLPDLEMKIHQHNLAVNAFLDIFGVEVEQPRISLDPPTLGYVVISVNDELPVAVADGQTLEVKSGDTVEVVHVGANYDRGLSVDVLGHGGLNDIRHPIELLKPASVVVRKDHLEIGRVSIGLLPADYSGNSPRLSGKGKIKPPKTATMVSAEEVALGRAAKVASATSVKPAEGFQVAANTDEPETPADSSASTIIGAEDPPPAADTDTPARAISGKVHAGGENAQSQLQGQGGDDPETVAANDNQPAGKKGIRFLLEVDGQPVELVDGQQLEVLSGSLVKMVDFASDSPLPRGLSMNLKGFVPKEKTRRNDGEDRGYTADTSRDMMAAFSVRQKGQIYEINAENGKEILAACSIKITKPRLESVTIEFDGKTRQLKAGSYITIPIGTEVTVTEIRLAEGQVLTQPRYTLGGRHFDSALPQILKMPSFAVNLAVFNGEALTGKVMWSPTR